MDAKIKKQWLKALRSGEYKKGINQLQWDDGSGNQTFCCLGVLCDIQGRKWDRAKVLTSNIPKKWAAGLSKKQMNDLAARNDGAGLAKHSFKHIADLIETYL